MKEGSWKTVIARERIYCEILISSLVVLKEWGIDKNKRVLFAVTHCWCLVNAKENSQCGELCLPSYICTHHKGMW